MTVYEGQCYGGPKHGHWTSEPYSYFKVHLMKKVKCVVGDMPVNLMYETGAYKWVNGSWLYEGPPWHTENDMKYLQALTEFKRYCRTHDIDPEGAKITIEFPKAEAAHRMASHVMSEMTEYSLCGRYVNGPLTYGGLRIEIDYDEVVTTHKKGKAL